MGGGNYCNDSLSTSHLNTPVTDIYLPLLSLKIMTLKSCLRMSLRGNSSRLLETFSAAVLRKQGGSVCSSKIKRCASRDLKHISELLFGGESCK